MSGWSRVANPPLRLGRCVGFASLAVILLLLSACGSGASHGVGGHSGGRGSAATRGAGVSTAEAAVIEGWANALRAGEPKRAATYWADPSVMVNGPDANGQVTLVHIRNAHEAQLADESLSCGATLRHAMRSGSYIEGEFTLSIRTGAGASSSGCSGPASVDFLISSGHIVRWLRAPIVSSVPPSGGTPAAQKGATPQSI
jgi:hypothetical protein